MTTLLGLIQDDVLVMGADGRGIDGNLVNETVMKTARLCSVVCVGFGGAASVRVPIMARLLRHPEWETSDTVFEQWEQSGEVLECTYAEARAAIDRLIHEQWCSGRRGKLGVLLGGRDCDTWRLCKWWLGAGGGLIREEPAVAIYPVPLGFHPHMPEEDAEELKRMLLTDQLSAVEKLVCAIRNVEAVTTERSATGVKAVNGDALIRSSVSDVPFSMHWERIPSNSQTPSRP